MLQSSVRFRCFLFVLVVFGVFVYLAYNYGLWNKGTSKSKIFAELRKLDPSQFANESDFTCEPIRILNLTFKMCDHPDTRKLTSNGRYVYDEATVIKFINMFRHYNRHDVSFIDVGANIGLYTLPMSQVCTQVVAVEPSPDIYKCLAKSIHHNPAFANIVDALNIAISNQSFTSALSRSSSGHGDTYLLPLGSSECKPPNCWTTLTTTLDNLLPIIRNRKVVMKVDVQESEIKIFTREGASKFFEELDVQLILMEFILYKERYGKTEDKGRQVDRFLEFFFERGYDVYDPLSEKSLTGDWRKWTYDILLKKKNLPKEKLFYIE